MHRALTALPLLLLATVALAQTPPPQQRPQEPGQELVGLKIFSSDGSLIGTVNCVSRKDGKVVSIHPLVRGFLGIGQEPVAIPEGKFTKTGERIQLAMTADEVLKLPKEQCSS